MLEQDKDAVVGATGQSLLHASTFSSRHPAQDTGFTLIEVIISLAITAVITSLLYGTFRTTIETSGGIDEQADVYRRARVIFHQLDKDISMIYKKQTEPGTTEAISPSEEVPFGSTPFKGANEIRMASGGVYPADVLNFVSLSFQPVYKGVPLSGQAEISYSIVEDALVRHARFREKTVQQELSESVLGLNFRYFDGKKKEWQDEWEPPNILPTAIEIELILKRSSAHKPPSIPNLEEPIFGYRFKTILAIPVSETLTS